MSLEIDRCDLEIANAKALLRSGHPDVAGLMLALHDWQAERNLIVGNSKKPKTARMLLGQFLASLEKQGLGDSPEAKQLKSELSPESETSQLPSRLIAQVASRPTSGR